MRTNKAAALAKFLERKLQEPDGLASINPDLVELAVQNAKHAVLSGIFFFSLFLTKLPNCLRICEGTYEFSFSDVFFSSDLN